MRLEIYPILPEEVNGRYRLDLDERIAIVDIDLEQRRGSFRFYDPSYEKSLRRMFEEDCAEFVGGAVGGDGVKVHPAWSKDALKVIVRQKLQRISLGARAAAPQERPDS